MLNVWKYKFTGISKTTLHNHANYNVKSCKRGRPPLFNEQQEAFLVDYIKTLARWGYPLDKQKVKELAAEYALQCDIYFNSSIWSPGEDWLREWVKIKFLTSLKFKNSAIFNILKIHKIQ